MGSGGPLSVSRPADRRLYRRRRLALFAAGVVAYGVFRLAGAVPGVVEAIYADRIGAVLAWPLSRLADLLPFSVFEVLVVAFVLRQVVGGAVALWELTRRRRHWRNAAAAGALRLGQDAGIAVALFYLLWGFNYVRQPLERRVGLAPVDSVSVEELAGLAREAVDATNAAYRTLHGRDDADRPTRGAAADRAPLFAALDAGWQAVVDSFELAGPVAWRYGTPKPFLFAGLFKRVGVSGMYAPFTGEALVVGDLPAVSYPKSAAHEQAHQRGVTHEAEANFLGYLASAWAPHAHARYSAHAFAMRQLLGTLGAADRARWRAEWARVLPGVERDLRDLQAFWARYEGALEEVGTRMNDAFLKSNRVEEGVVAYSRSVELIIALARARGGLVSSGPSP